MSAPPREASMLGVVFRAAEAAIESASDGPESLALLRAAIAPQMALASRLGAWPVAELPLAIHRALDGEPERAVTLAAACALFFASADVIDDAEDGDLDAARFGGWQQAVNAGHALSFLAPGVAAEAASPRRRAAVAEAFSAAGLAMSLGQRRDLAQQGSPALGLSEADYLAAIRGKAGAAFKLYATLPAIALGRAASLVGALAAFGEALGMAVQLASDTADLLGPESRDVRQQQLTLPVIVAWQRLAAADRPLLLAAWAREPEAVPLDFLLDRTGALAYSRARLATLRLEAEQALVARAVPASVRSALSPLLAAIAAQAGPAIA